MITHIPVQTLTLADLMAFHGLLLTIRETPRGFVVESNVDLLGWDGYEHFGYLSAYASRDLALAMFCSNLSGKGLARMYRSWFRSRYLNFTSIKVVPE